MILQKILKSKSIRSKMIYTITKPCTRCGAVWNYDFEIPYYTTEHFCLSCLINEANVYYDFNVKIISRQDKKKRTNDNNTTKNV